jgi:hypothetical protein
MKQEHKVQCPRWPTTAVPSSAMNEDSRATRKQSR